MAFIEIPNGSFEFGGLTRGSADGWTKLSSVADILPACFDGVLFMGITIVEGFGFESFEQWTGQDIGLEDLDDAIAASFSPPPGESFDGFEHDWQNSLFFFEFEIAILATGLFTGTPITSFDGFEHDWDNNDFHFDLSTVTVIFAMYDPGLLEAFEDFEEEWKSNEDFDFDLSTVTTVTALYDLGFIDAEEFEGTWTLVLDI